MNRQSVENVQGSKSNLYDIKMKDICYYTSVQTHRMYTKNGPQGKLWILSDQDLSMQVHQCRYNVGTLYAMYHSDEWLCTCWVVGMLENFVPFHFF